MKTFVKRYLGPIEWGLGVFVVVSTLVVWAMNTSFTGGITVYDIFPPLGIVAFGLMWTHFVMSALRRYAHVTSARDNAYSAISMGLVLGLIIMHPLLLWIALYNDGLGLPPQSYYMVYKNEAIAVTLGSIGLTIFLAYEFKRFFGNRSWWKYVDYAQIVGMIAIFIHGIGLGRDIQLGYLPIWIFYGLTLVAAVTYSYLPQRSSSR